MTQYIRTDIRGLLDKAQQDLAERIHLRDQLNVQIIDLQRQAQSLAALVWRDELTQQQNDIQQAVVGISDAIRSILRLQGKPMTAAQVKDCLDLMGYNFAGMTNASSVVHNTLKRMAGTGELVFVPAAKTYEFPFARVFSHLDTVPA